MSLKTSEIRKMIKNGNDGSHDAIIDAFKQWKGFLVVEIDGLNVIADGRSLTDDEIRAWLDWCEGL